MLPKTKESTFFELRKNETAAKKFDEKLKMKNNHNKGVQINILRPAKSEQTLNKVLLKADKPAVHLEAPENGGFFTADTKAQILLNDKVIDLQKKSREDMKKVFHIFYKKLGKRKKSAPKKGVKRTPSLLRQLSSHTKPPTINTGSAEQPPFSPRGESRAFSPPKCETVYINSPVYGPLRKIEKDPAEDDFRQIFKKYYKELPLYKPRVSKDRLSSNDLKIDTAILELDISFDPKPTNRKEKSKETLKSSIYSISKTINEGSADSKRILHEPNEDVCYDVTAEDVVQRLIDILAEFKMGVEGIERPESPVVISPLGAVTIPTISRPASAMNTNINSNIKSSSNNNPVGNMSSIESLFSAGKHLPASKARPGTAGNIANNSIGGSSSGKLLPLMSKPRPKSSENRKAVVQRAILTKTDPAKTWTIPDAYK